MAGAEIDRAARAGQGANGLAGVGEVQRAAVDRERAGGERAPDCRVSVPAETVVPPVKVFVPSSSQVPAPDLTRAVVPLPSTRAAESVFTAVLVPVSVRVLLPAPVAVSAEVSVSAPEPEASSVPPPVVPARLMTRLELSPVPVYWSVPLVVVAPRSMVPLPAVAGAPSAEKGCRCWRGC